MKKITLAIALCATTFAVKAQITIDPEIGLNFNKIKWVQTLIVLEIATGIAMYYFDFPLGSQPAHLIIASLLFGVQFYLILESKKSQNNFNDIQNIL